MNDLDMKRKAYSARNYASSKEKFPKEAHLAIIEFGSIHVPGDERSRTNPGHGYPAHDVGTMSYIWYKLEDEDCWKHDILERMTGSYSSKQFIALKDGKIYEPKLGLV